MTIINKLEELLTSLQKYNELFDLLWTGNIELDRQGKENKLMLYKEYLEPNSAIKSFIIEEYDINIYKDNFRVYRDLFFLYLKNNPKITEYINELNRELMETQLKELINMEAGKKVYEDTGYFL